jgi:predicted SAM-dependent methyltransferase
MYLDLTKYWPVSPGRVDRIYGDNVIEHFSLDAVRVVLRHWWEALSVGSRLHLAMPGFERTARAYLDDPS